MATFQTQAQFLPVGGNVNMTGAPVPPQYQNVNTMQAEATQPIGIPVSSQQHQPRPNVPQGNAWGLSLIHI